MHVLFPNTLQVNVIGHDEANDQLQNIFHVLTTEAPTQEDCDAVAEIVRAWTVADYPDRWAVNISSDRVIVTDVSVLDSWQTEVAAVASGEYIGLAVPSSVTMAVKKSTGKRGRAQRGNWYAWPPTSAQLEELDSNLFLESYRDGLVATLELLRTQLLAGGYTLAVASAATGQVLPVKNFVAVDRQVDSQRRRLRGRGR